MIQPNDRDKIEAIIDRTSLRDVLQGIAQICYDKAEHIASNWQDHPLSMTWDRAAGLIEKVTVNEKIKAVL